MQTKTGRMLAGSTAAAVVIFLLVFMHGTSSTLEVWAEVVHGTYDLLGGGSREQLGYFVQPAYRFSNGITPYVRYEWIDPDRDADDDDGTDLIVGVNYEMATWFHIKLENNYFKGGKNSSLAEFP